MATSDIDEIQRNADWMYGIWFTPHPEGHDFMLQLLRSMGKWHMVLRFRYYKDDSGKVFDSGDEKRWYSASADDDSNASRDKMIASIDQLMSEMQHPPPGLTPYYPSDFLLLDCPTNSDEMVEKFDKANKPWLHIKKVEKGDPDYEKYHQQLEGE